MNLCVHVFAGICFLVQNDWDEVKGKCPLVYEDMFSEARPSSLLGFVQKHVFRCTYFYWHLTFFQIVWDEVQDTRSPPYLHVLRAETRLDASKRVIGMQDSSLGPHTLMLGFLFGMYWLSMMAVFQLQFVNDDNVKWVYEFTIHLIRNCSICVVWIVAQHCCVLGLCHMALELHRRMLGQAHQGLGSYRCLVPRIANSCIVLLSLLIRALFFQVAMFIIVEVIEATFSLLYRAAKPCREQLHLPYVVKGVQCIEILC